MGSGDKIKSKISNFSFGGITPKYFDNHVNKSVPFYKEGHNIICKLSSFFVSENCNIYDLGCSTGTLLKKIDTYNSLNSMKLHGIDVEKKMLQQAKKKLLNCKNKIILNNSSINNLKFKKSDLIISYYTLQFVRPKYRQKIINKIYKSLNLGSGFIWFEKVRASDAKYQDIISQLYQEYKTDIGYTQNEVWNKTVSIRSILEPFTTLQNTKMLRKAGFKNFTSILKYYNFEGYLAIK